MSPHPVRDASVVVARALILGAAFALAWGALSDGGSFVRFAERAAIFGGASLASIVVGDRMVRRRREARRSAGR